jgi:hypothetical protein
MLMHAYENKILGMDECGFQFDQKDDTRPKCVPKYWILLDNQSTLDVFYNPYLLENLRETNTSMSIHCNAGITTTIKKGDLPGYGTVWFHTNGLANILSLARIEEKN